MSTSANVEIMVVSNDDGTVRLFAPEQLPAGSVVANPNQPVVAQYKLEALASEFGASQLSFCMSQLEQQSTCLRCELVCATRG